MTSLRFDDGAARHDLSPVISSLKPRNGEVIPSWATAGIRNEARSPSWS